MRRAGPASGRPARSRPARCRPARGRPARGRPARADRRDGALHRYNRLDAPSCRLRDPRCWETGGWTCGWSGCELVGGPGGLERLDRGRRLGGIGWLDRGRRLGGFRGRGGGDGLVVGFAELGDFGVGVVEPVGGPQPVEAPAEAFQVLLAQPVTVPDAARVAVGRAVGLHGQDHPRRVIRMRGGEVDAVAAHAVLGHHGDAVVRQPGPTGPRTASGPTARAPHAAR